MRDTDGDRKPTTAAGRALILELATGQVKGSLPQDAGGLQYAAAYIASQGIIPLIEHEAALLARPVEPLDVERLATALGGWLRVRDDTCGQQPPCVHDRLLAGVLIDEYERRPPSADSAWAEPLPPRPGFVPTPSDGHAHEWSHTTGGAHDYCVTCGLVRWPGGPTCPICGATHEHAHGDAQDFPVRWRP